MLRLCAGLCVAAALASAGACNRDGKKSAKADDAAALALKLKRQGVAHASPIDRVALSMDGKVAVSRDAGGGIRLWPSLDGKREPIALPGQAVEQLSVAAAGGRFVVTLVDTAGGAQILSVSAQGDTKQLASLPPFDPLVEAHLLPGGTQLVTLHRDRTTRLLRVSGEEVGRFEQRRYAPTQLRVSQNGKRVVGVVVERQTGDGFEGYVQPLDITGSPGRPFASRPPERFRTSFQPTPQNAVLSPDGRLWVVLGRDRAGAKLRAFVHDLGRPGSRRSLQLEIPAHDEPSLGFVGPFELMASTTRRDSTAWVLDLRRGRTVQRAAPPRNTPVRAHASRTQIAGFGTWLFVHDVSSSTQRYLGYGSFVPSSVAFSPSGEHLAWGVGRSEIYVESLTGSEEPKKYKGEEDDRIRWVFFADDEHIVAVDSRETVQLIKWESGEVVAETGVDGRVSNVEYEPESRILLADRHRQGKRFFEVDPEKGFSGPYILPDESVRSGLFSRKSGSGSAFWSVMDDGKLRSYSLTELRRGMAVEEVLKKGDLLPPGFLLAIDRSGNRYISYNGRLTVGRGVRSRTVELRVDRLYPSWDGKTVLAPKFERDNALITAYDTATMEERWVHRMSIPPNDVAWSQDGRYVAMSSEAGGLVLDAKTGKPVAYRCGLGFEVKGAPPKDAFDGASDRRSVCEP